MTASEVLKVCKKKTAKGISQVYVTLWDISFHI